MAKTIEMISFRAKTDVPKSARPRTSATITRAPTSAAAMATIAITPVTFRERVVVGKGAVSIDSCMFSLPDPPSRPAAYCYAWISATGLHQPAEARATLTGKAITSNPVPGKRCRLASFSMWQ
jgi:hypothetical protein